MFLLTFLKDTGAVDFQNSRVVFVFLVETHAGQINRCLAERHMTRVGKEGGRRGGMQWLSDSDSPAPPAVLKFVGRKTLPKFPDFHVLALRRR